MHEMIPADRRDQLGRERAVAVLVGAVSGGDIVAFADVDEGAAVEFELHEGEAGEGAEGEGVADGGEGGLVVGAELGEEVAVREDG